MLLEQQVQTSGGGRDGQAGEKQSEKREPAPLEDATRRVPDQSVTNLILWVIPAKKDKPINFSLKL